MEIQNAQMPPILGLKTPLPVLAQSADLIRPATGIEAVRPLAADGRCFAGVLSSDKGLAYHVLLECGVPLPAAVAEPAPAATNKAAAPPPLGIGPIPSSRSSAAAWSILRVGAGTQDALVAKLQLALGDPALGVRQRRGFTLRACRSGPLGHRRQAEALSQKLQSAAKQLGNPAALPVLEQQGCFYRHLTAEPPRIALLFPLKARSIRHAPRTRGDIPAAAAMMHQIDGVLWRRGFNSFAEMAWHDPAQLGVDVWVTQIVMLVSDLIVHAALKRLRRAGGSRRGAQLWRVRRPRRERRGISRPSSRPLGAIRSNHGHPRLPRHIDGVHGPGRFDRTPRVDTRQRVFAANYKCRTKPSSGGASLCLQNFLRLLERKRIDARCCRCPAHSTLP